MKQINIPYYLGQFVYFKTDEDQKKHIVVGIIIRNEGLCLEVSHNGEVKLVYDFEVTTQSDLLVKLGINNSNDNNFD